MSGKKDDSPPEDEWGLVDWVRTRASGSLPPSAVGPGDDAAVLSWDGADLVVTTDVITEGTHFFPDADPVRVGRFAAAVNLSDLAAMGASPRGLVAACAAPATVPGDWFRGVAQGLLSGLAPFDCPLLGGDTKTAAARFVAATAFGGVPKGKAVRRGGARGDDVIVATGRFGAPGTALRGLAEGRWSRSEAMEVVFDVTPRVEAGIVLREAGTRAMVDTSDGLARAAALIAQESGTRVELDLAAVPVDERVREVFGEDRGAAGWRQGVLATGGEYELVAAVPADRVDEAQERVKALGVPLTRVGVVAEGSGVWGVLDKQESDLSGLGWRQR